MIEVRGNLSNRHTGPVSRYGVNSSRYPRPVVVDPVFQRDDKIRCHSRPVSRYGVNSGGNPIIIGRPDARYGLDPRYRSGMTKYLILMWARACSSTEELSSYTRLVLGSNPSMPTSGLRIISVMADEKGKKKEFIYCPNCESRVQAIVVAESEFFIEEMDTPEYIYLMECAVCNIPIVGHAEIIQTAADKYETCSPVRVWPDPQKSTPWQIPSFARHSIDEADRCYKAKAYNACVVMCGRALEAICKNHDVDMGSLASGLKGLREKGVIDGRLLEWGDALRQARNIGAHATDIETSREDARDVLDFTNAIGEYIYVLGEKFKEFMERKKANLTDTVNKI